MTPMWVLRWRGPFGIAYVGDHPDSVTFRSHIVFEVEQATMHFTKEEAESAALFLSAKYPHEFLGKLNPREWYPKRKHP